MIFASGIPPYQEDTEKSTRKKPVYNDFMDAAFQVANTVELITPGRFLFEAGQTPGEWNKKMLEDEHFKVLHYEEDATRIFANTEIKGGVIISIRDNQKKYGKISVFTPYEELNSIVHKVIRKKVTSIDIMISSRGMYRLDEKFFIDFPQASSRVGEGTGNMIVSNIFEKMPEAFTEKPSNDKCYSVLGRKGNKRVFRFLNSEYLIDNRYVNKYKVCFPEANGNGVFGEVLTLPEIGEPGICTTDTFINIGPFESEEEAINLAKYIKTKTLRALLYVRKATQHSPKSVWKYVPLQDFAESSDIDWSKSVAEIDQQLYKKYGLSEKEINFIETHVKEMK